MKPLIRNNKKNEGIKFHKQFMNDKRNIQNLKKNLVNQFNSFKTNTNQMISNGWTWFNGARDKKGLENPKGLVSITYEEIGLFPRSFNRVFDRFFKQVFSDVENLVVQEYRFYRYLFLTTVRCLFLLVFVPFCVNFLAKNYVIRPITEYYWNTKQTEIFLNSYQQKSAFEEFGDFEEKLFFESLIYDEDKSWGWLAERKTLSKELINQTNGLVHLQEDLTNEGSLNKFQKLDWKEDTKNLINLEKNLPVSLKINAKDAKDLTPEFQDSKFISSAKKLEFQDLKGLGPESKDVYRPENVVKRDDSSEKILKNKMMDSLNQKTLELALRYNEQSIEAITNFFADLLSFGTLCFLFFSLEIQINITKSFLLEVFFGLDDSKKSLLILFMTDLLVGYHSPNIWELLFGSFFMHYGIPENETTIFLLVATLPVLLDVLFKYLIFRHLNRASPATVATYHAMIE